MCLFYHKDIFPWGKSKSFSFIYKAKIFFLLCVAPQSKQEQAGWVRAISRLVTWFLVYTGCYFASDSLRIPRQALAGRLPGSVIESTNTLISDWSYPVHIFAFLYSSKEVLPGENWSSSPLTVFPVGLDVCTDLFFAHTTNFFGCFFLVVTNFLKD